jgi:hypothetical protein
MMMMMMNDLVSPLEIGSSSTLKNQVFHIKCFANNVRTHGATIFYHTSSQDIHQEVVERCR